MTPYLVELISVTVALKRNGKRYQGLCPFHEERTPSFQVWDSGRKWRWHCHGCGATGDDIEWLRRTRNLTFKQAAATVGLAVPVLTAKERAGKAAAKREHALAHNRNFNEQIMWARRLDKHYGIRAADDILTAGIPPGEVLGWLGDWRVWLASRTNG